MTETLSHSSSGHLEAEISASSHDPPGDESDIDNSYVEIPSVILLRNLSSDNNSLTYIDEGIKTLLLQHFGAEVCRDRTHPVGQYIGHMLELLTGPHEDLSQQQQNRIEAIQTILNVLSQEYGIDSGSLALESLITAGKRSLEEDYEETDG